MLAQIAPSEGAKGPPYLEHDGGHDPRLTSSGTAVLLNIVRRLGFDDLMRRLGYTDPAEFLHTQLGYRSEHEEIVCRKSRTETRLNWRVSILLGDKNLVSN